MSEYLSRREFNKRVILGISMVIGGTVDSLYTVNKSIKIDNKTKEELHEKGTTPTTSVEKKSET